MKQKIVLTPEELAKESRGEAAYIKEDQLFVIEDGKLGAPVNLVVASGNITKVLNDVLSIGSDLDFKTGNIGAPSLLVGGMSISGK